MIKRDPAATANGRRFATRCVLRDGLHACLALASGRVASIQAVMLWTWRCAIVLGHLPRGVLCRARRTGAGITRAWAWSFHFVINTLCDHRPCHSLMIRTHLRLKAQLAVRFGKERRQCIWQSSGCKLLEPTWHWAWPRFVDAAIQWTFAATDAFVQAALACRAPW